MATARFLLLGTVRRTGKEWPFATAIMDGCGASQAHGVVVVSSKSDERGVRAGRLAGVILLTLAVVGIPAGHSSCSVFGGAQTPPDVMAARTVLPPGHAPPW
jgi:hypothetical protein